MGKGKKNKSAGNYQLTGKNTLVNGIEKIVRCRLINSEYQRGFMEGQRAAAKEVVSLVDSMMSRFDHVAVATKLSRETVRI